MVLDKLSDSLKSTLSKIASSLFVDEKLVNELIKDIQKALLQSDVNVKLVFELTKGIKARALNDELPPGLSRREHLVNIVYEELTTFLGGEKNEIKVDKTKKPFKIMLVGLFGSGKTTSAGKIAKFYMKRGMKVAAVGLDVWRPAAMDQLEQVTKQVNVPSFINREEKDPVKIYKEFEPKLKDFDIVLIDTAGRDALNEELIAEIEDIGKEVNADERLLVISADIGQTAQAQAQQFNDSCGITGVVVTKMDGTAKAGGALSACAVTESPIVFIGVGEKVDDLEQFNPPGFVSRILGMGDLEALLEKAKDAVSEEEAQDLGKKLMKGEFNLIDLYSQMKAMSKMGSMAKIMEMIPGMGQLKLPKEALNVQEGKLKKWKHVMGSMTKKELEDPDIISSDRVGRIAKGSGMPEKDVRELLKQYRMSKKMMKMMKGQDMDKMMTGMQTGKMPKGMGGLMKKFGKRK